MGLVDGNRGDVRGKPTSGSSCRTSENAYSANGTGRGRRSGPVVEGRFRSHDGTGSLSAPLLHLDVPYAQRPRQPRSPLARDEQRS